MPNKGKKCNVTGEHQCKCGPKKHKVAASKRPTLKETLRKLFTDHAVYTRFYMNDYLHGCSSKASLDATVARLMENQKDIGDGIEFKIGQDNAHQLTKLLQEHIGLAAQVLNAVKNESSAKLQSALSELFNNADRVGAFLHELNPRKLPLAVVTKEFRQHNQHVVDMATLILKSEWKASLEKYDQYYNHMLHFSDLLYHALV